MDLDLPEYDVRVDERGAVVSVTQILRDRSHGLVEELSVLVIHGLYHILGYDHEDEEEAARGFVS